MSELNKSFINTVSPTFGIFLTSKSPVIAQTLSHCGYDWLLIDCQHGSMSFETMTQLIQSVKRGKAKCMVRISDFNNRKEIQIALDSGADGLLVPTINNKNEAEQALKHMMFPPEGSRSAYWPLLCNASSNDFTSYIKDTNRQIVVAMQIETAEGLENIESIASIPRIDILFMGKTDLSISLNLYNKYEVGSVITKSDEMMKAETIFFQVCKEYKKVAGIYLLDYNSESVSNYISKGARFISLGDDVGYVYIKSTENLKNANKK